ncbi:MAG: hypothetical protein HY363_04010 [Candidatus Aenigmarchaeota archaeon]|nr:hypothetical protein [Candidatus Aenigmarchaeota archaeon]
MKFDVMKAVYCYFFPETREVLRRIILPDELFLVSSTAKSVERFLATRLPLNPPLQISATSEGRVDLDAIHEPIMSRIKKAYTQVVQHLTDFNYNYPTSGSSEGIFHLLAQLKTTGVNSINVLSGEYEGFGIQAQNLGINVITREQEDIGEPGYWFISNPSARDGNILPNSFINKLCSNGHRVILDIAYVGSTKQHKFDVRHENIRAVVMSFSKPYGTFRFRTGGFVFSRHEIPSLYGNKWFKDITRLFQAVALAELIGPVKLWNKYVQVQKKIISSINNEFGLNMRQSDALLLGYITDRDAKVLTAEQQKLIAPFQRGAGYRFCLTPYFEAFEANEFV